MKSTYQNITNKILFEPIMKNLEIFNMKIASGLFKLCSWQSRILSASLTLYCMHRLLLLITLSFFSSIFHLSSLALGK